MLYFQGPFRRFRRRVQRLSAGLKVHNMYNNLVNTMSNPAEKQALSIEVPMFSQLLSRYIAHAGQKLEWEKVHSPALNQIIPYNQLARPTDEAALFNRLAVLKLNGGLGTSMGMQGAKGALEVKNDLTFLDLVVQQITDVNSSHAVDIPLLLMTSFNTHDDTLRITQKYKNQVRIAPFIQSKYPRIMKDSLLPYATSEQYGSAWYPPGHGDVYTSLCRSGMLDRLLKEGKQYLFVSNSDNLGAMLVETPLIYGWNVDSRILQHMIHTKTDFLMEVTDRTKADITASLKKIMDKGGMELEIIANPKITDDGRSIIQA
ncbi:hypothetical protein C0991_001645 [Blastosporella zonata]|nr:hypothetical protein C0991_001645 [Blastosporella zonata]